MTIAGFQIPPGGIGLIFGIAAITVYALYARTHVVGLDSIAVFIAGHGFWSGGRLVLLAVMLGDEHFGTLPASRLEIAVGGLAVIAVAAAGFRSAWGSARQKRAKEEGMSKDKDGLSAA